MSLTIITRIVSADWAAITLSPDFPYLCVQPRYRSCVRKQREKVRPTGKSENPSYDLVVGGSGVKLPQGPLIGQRRFGRLFEQGVDVLRSLDQLSSVRI